MELAYQEHTHTALEDASAVLQQGFRFTREILLENDTDELLRKIVDAAMALTGAERGVLALRQHGRLSLVVGRSHGRDIPNPENHINHTLLERTLRDGVARVTTDALEDESLRSVASVTDLGLRSVICVPLIGKRSYALGALYLDNTFEQGFFDAHHLELAKSFCGQAVLAWAAPERRQERENLVQRLKEAMSKLEEELAISRLETSRHVRNREKQFAGIVGDSSSIRDVFHIIEVVAPTNISVLIRGESGVGKELVARALWQHSNRKEHPFIAENCGAVPASLLESVLFGHVKGAFTGADRDRRGLFEMAHRGTLFLDEIAELPAELQTRLLRVLQEGEIRRLGSQKVVRVDVRVVSASNRDLDAAMTEGKLREDLYYRLQGTEIHVPPLRRRRDDIPLLADHFIRDMTEEGQSPKRLSAEALDRLVKYPWPGNVRELENELRRLVLLAPTRVIGVEFVSDNVRDGVAPRMEASCESSRPVRSLREVEQDAILHAVSTYDGHRGKVAKALGISRSTLYLKLKDIGYEA
jgi:transcriptional regulator with GAF, ATPase, and Fis domain